MSKEKVMLSELQPGEVFCGNGERKYIVLKQEEGQTKIISLGLMEEDKKFDCSSADYKKSDMKELIETDIQPLIEEDFGANNLVEHEVDLTTADMQKNYGTCTCKVRPITFDEAREFNHLIVCENLPDWYWTCTAWSTEKRGWSRVLAIVCPFGDVLRNDCYFNYGVRPVCILKSNIFVSKEE